MYEFIEISSQLTLFVKIIVKGKVLGVAERDRLTFHLKETRQRSKHSVLRCHSNNITHRGGHHKVT